MEKRHNRQRQQRELPVVEARDVQIRVADQWRDTFFQGFPFRRQPREALHRRQTNVGVWVMQRIGNHRKCGGGAVRTKRKDAR